MAKKKLSKLQSRIKKSNARENSRTAEMKRPGNGGGRLPAGVEGVAKVTRVDFDEITKGDYEGSNRFYCHGTVVTPESFTDDNGNTIRCAGKLVQPGIITLDDTTNYNDEEVSFEENVAKAENRLKLLGFPTEDFDDLVDETLEYFEDNKDELYFSFRTWSPEDEDGDGEARVIHIIEGPCDAPDVDASDDIEDDEEEEEEAPKPKRKAKAKKKVVEEEEEEEEEEVVEEEEVDEEEEESDEDEEDGSEEEEDLDALAEAADDDDEDAQLTLSNIAEGLGIDPEDDEFGDWASVAAAIAEAQDGGSDADEEDEEEDEDDAIEVGDTVSFKPPRARKVSDFEVVKVWKSGALDLKGPRGKVIKKVDPSELA